MNCLIELFLLVGSIFVFLYLKQNLRGYKEFVLMDFLANSFPND